MNKEAAVRLSESYSQPGSTAWDGNVKHGNYKVRVVDSVPRMRLSESLPVSDECRNEMNAWLLSFFGYHTPLLGNNQALLDKDSGVIYVSQQVFTAIKKGKLQPQSMGAKFEPSTVGTLFGVPITGTIKDTLGS